MKRSSWILLTAFFSLIIVDTAVAGLGEGVAAFNAKNYEVALRELRPQATRGNVTAQNLLATMYNRGAGVQRNPAEAAKWFRKAAEQGHAPSQNMLGLLYERGEGVEQDVIEAAKWIEKAAKQNDPNAMLNLGLYYKSGKGVAKDTNKANDIFKRAIALLQIKAEKGDVESQGILAQRVYAKGLGVPQNLEQANYWYRKAAEQGSAMAQYNLGANYKNGVGVTADTAEAVKWFRMAAAQGDVNAERILGSIYALGEGNVPADAVESNKWFRLAAAQEDALSQYLLGLAYCRGSGVEQDETEAMQWLRKAAENGHPEAKALLGAMLLGVKCGPSKQSPGNSPASTPPSEVKARPQVPLSVFE